MLLTYTSAEPADAGSPQPALSPTLTALDPFTNTLLDPLAYDAWWNGLGVGLACPICKSTFALQTPGISLD